MTVAKSEDFDGVAQGDALTRLRLLSKQTRTQVAVKIPMEADTYGKYESGRSELRLGQFKAFAAALGVSTATLCWSLGLLDTDEIARISEGDKLLEEALQKMLSPLPPGQREEVLGGLSQEIASKKP